MNSMAVVEIAVTDSAHKLGLVLEREEMEWYRQDYMKAEWEAYKKEYWGLVIEAEENLKILKNTYRILYT